MNGLLKSRKFWLAVFAMVQAIVLHYLNVPDDIWQSITAMIMILIAAIATEDFAEKNNKLNIKTEKPAENVTDE